MQQSRRSDLSRRCPCRFTQCKEILVEVVCLLAKTGLWSLRTANVSSVSKRQSARLKDAENKCELDVFKQFGTK